MTSAEECSGSERRLYPPLRSSPFHHDREPEAAEALAPPMEDRIDRDDQSQSASSFFAGPGGSVWFWSAGALPQGNGMMGWTAPDGIGCARMSSLRSQTREPSV
ncbi:hypothetical protein, partial [Mesorhizobium sp. M0898]|uniref:hypothetical protein n=1 Tax=Mesorhizobium sp. M0898 TaxID=2957020 RepID=UPI00333BC4B0